MNRPPAHHLELVLALGLLSACGGPSLPRPAHAQVSVDDYVAVPFAPRAPPVEIVPAQPRPNAVWVDGTWSWSGERYNWQSGYWVLPPEGAAHARWTVVRRAEDGQLFFAPSAWKDRGGKTLPEAPVPLVSARSRATDED